jgi:hypothetical protein
MVSSLIETNWMMCLIYFSTVRLLCVSNSIYCILFWLVCVCVCVCARTRACVCVLVFTYLWSTLTWQPFFYNSVCDKYFYNAIKKKIKTHECDFFLQCNTFVNEFFWELTNKYVNMIGAIYYWKQFTFQWKTKKSFL